MLHVILTILKIIGIVLGILLGLLLLVLLAVLFVPLRYKVKGKKQEEINGIFRISWLFHIISGYASYDKQTFVYKVKIFGFPIINSLRDNSAKEARKEQKARNKEEKKSQKENRKSQKQDRKRKHSHAGDDEYVLEITEVEADSGTKDKLGAGLQVETRSGVAGNDADSGIKSEAGIGSESDTGAESGAGTDSLAESSVESGRRKLRHFCHRIKSKINAFCLKIKGIISKIKAVILKGIEIIKGIMDKTVSLWDTITEKIRYFSEELNTEENRQVLKFLISQLKIILKHIAPRKYKIYVKFGASEPDVTGKVIGGVAIANAVFNVKMNFVPVFDEQVFEGKVSFKGHVRVFPILIVAFRVYRNKQFKKIIKKFK